MKKILLNFVTMGKEGIDIPRLSKLQQFNSFGLELHLFSGQFIKKIDLSGKDIYFFNETVPEFKELSNPKGTKMGFIYFALKRNLKVLLFWRRIAKGNFDIIYSPAAVLDFVIFPYFYKILHSEIKWAVSLENIVPFSDLGNKFIRFLAWIFFQASVLMLRKADIIFLPTPELRSYMLQRGFPEKKLVDTCFAVENELIEKAHELHDIRIDALFMGRINETKGIYDMLKVLEIIVTKYSDFQLAIMGEGDDNSKKKFRDKIAKLKLKKNIQFLGFQVGQKKHDIIRSAKCFWFLSVSKSESFGMALLEAVCSGIPAFAYDLPQFSRIYPNGEVNISPIGDFKLVAKEVLRLFESGNFSNEKGKLLLGKYSWKKAADLEFKAIKNILQTN